MPVDENDSCHEREVMTRDSDSLFISEAARDSWLLWFAVIGFFAVGGILASLLSRFGL